MGTTPDVESQLARVPLFVSLSRRQIKKLVDRGRRVTHGSGRDIVEEDKGSLAFHLIISGTASVHVHDRQVRDLGPGDYFGEISMIDGRPRSATVTTTSDVVTLAIPHTAFEQLLDEQPEVARQLLVRLCDRLRQAESERGA